MTDDALNKPISELDYIMHGDELDWEYAECLCSAEDFLEHHGVKGMHWGVRRSLQELGYRVGENKRKKRAAKIKAREKNLKLRMKELELDEKERELEKRSAPASKDGSGKTLKEISDSFVNTKEGERLNAVFNRKDRANFLNKNVTSLTTEEITRANARLKGEEQLRKYAEDEKTRTSALGRARSTAKELRDIVKEAKDTADTVKSLVSGGKKVKEALSGNKSASDSAKSAGKDKAKSSGTSEKPVLDFNRRYDRRADRTERRRASGLNKRVMKIREQDHRAARKLANQGMRSIEAYVGAKTVDQLFKTAYQYNANQQMVDKRMKRVTKTPLVVFM